MNTHVAQTHTNTHTKNVKKTNLTANFVTDLKQLAGATVCLARSDIVVGIVVVVVEVNDEYESVNCLAKCTNDTH